MKKQANISISRPSALYKTSLQKLALIQLIISPSLLHQLLMASCLHDIALVDDENPAGLSYSRKAMGNDEGRTPF